MVENYSITIELAREMAYLAASTPKFYPRLGHVLEPDRMPDKASQLVLVGALGVASKSGGCSKPAYALQFLQELIGKGKLTNEDYALAEQLILEESKKQHDVDTVIDLAKPVIKKVLERNALEQGYNDYVSGTGLDNTVEMLSKARKLGMADASSGFTIGLDTLDRCFVEPVRDPLPTGIMEMDTRLRGGLERGGFGVFVAGTGVGKSLWLNQIAGEACYRGLNTLYVTLELMDSVVGDRIVRNLTGLTDLGQEQAKARHRYPLISKGKIHIQYMEPRFTSVLNIHNKIRELEKEHGWKPDLICVDPIDELIGNDRKAGRYEQINAAAAALRNLANEEDTYVWASSQPQRGKNRGKRLTVDDLADSMGKVRKATLVIGAWRTEEDEEMGTIRFAVAKRTQHEVGSAEIGPLVTDLNKARIVVTERAEPWL